MLTTFVVRRKIQAEYGMPSEIPEAKDQYAATFTTREAAEEHARRLHREAVAALPFAENNPFRNGEYAGLTTFPPNVFRDWLRDAGIEPPPAVDRRRSKRTDPETVLWADWWDAVADDLTEAQTARVWEGLNLFSLFEVVEVKAEQKLTAKTRTVYAVVCQNWQYDDNFYFGGNEPVAVYSTRKRAEDERKKWADALKELDEEDWEEAAGEYVVVELTLDAED